MDKPKTRILIFLAVTLALSALLWVPIIRAGNLALGGGLYILGVMWCPGVAAIITRLVTQGNLRGMGWKPRPAKLIGLAYILPLLYALPVYGLAWATGLGGFDPSKWVITDGGTMALGLLLLSTVGLLQSLLSATGEEIGWRGLLVPELAKLTSFRNTVLISSAIWAAWHMPLIIGANYHGEGTPIAYSIACFLGLVVALSAIMAWITLKSGSLWPAALLHATHNLFVQAVFDSATVDRGSTAWLTGEFGIGLVVTIAVAAALLLRFGGVPRTSIQSLEAEEK